MSRPRNTNSLADREMDRAEKQLDAFEDNIKSLTLDRMNEAPKLEVESQTKLSQKEIDRSKEVYLKPEKSIGNNDKFNEKFRERYEFDKQYVKFIAENKEIIGECIEIWTRPYGGIPAEFWKVPVNKPVWGPRYLAEQIKRCTYHRLSMRENVTTSVDGTGQYYGQMVVDNIINRLDAVPVSTRKSIFMGEESFA